MKEMSTSGKLTYMRRYAWQTVTSVSAEWIPAWIADHAAGFGTITPEQQDEIDLALIRKIVMGETIHVSDLFATFMIVTKRHHIDDRDCHCVTGRMRRDGGMQYCSACSMARCHTSHGTGAACKLTTRPARHQFEPAIEY